MTTKNIIEGIYHKFPNYWLENGANSFVQLTRDDTATLIGQRLIAANLPAERSSIRYFLAEIGMHQSIDYVLPRLPGYTAGLHRINNAKVLVPEALPIIEPAQGDAELCEAILVQMLGIEQMTYLFAWLKNGYICFRDHMLKPGQVVVLAGPQGCGKNLVQEQIITPIFGGSYAEPYRYAVNKTQFNMDHYKAMHLMIADQKNPADRAEMQEYIRRIASQCSEQLHPKNKEAISLEVLWRMTISCNEDEKDLRIIPPLQGLENKLMLFKCSLAPMPMPTADPHQYKAFGDAIRAEIPAFLDHILSFKTPDGLRDERFGVKGYINRELARMVHRLDREEELLELIREHKRFNPQWVLVDVTAGEIHDELFGQINLRDALRRTALSPNSTGKLLTKLVERNDSLVTSRILQGCCVYSINF